MTVKLLEARNVVKRYSHAQAPIEVLGGISCSVGLGQMVSVTGQSGAGKSTFLHVLGGLDHADSGTVCFRGRPLNTFSADDLADFRNRHLGFVFQFHHLLGEFSALENVMMPALIRRLPRAQARALAERALADVQLSPRLMHRPGELSGGEQQRVALARALVLEPQVLLADEVTGNVDEDTGEAIHALLFELNRQRGVAQVIVTHNRALAERMPVRWHLAHGQLQERT